MLAAVNFHYIRPSFDAPYPAIFGLTPEAFRRQLVTLADFGEFISQDDLHNHFVNGLSIPERSILITFDDGLREQYELALPILNELGIPAVFYINTRVLVEPIVTNVHLIHLVRSMLSPADISNALLTRQKNLAPGQIDTKAARASGIEHYKYDDPDSAELKYLLNFVYPSEFVESVFLELFTNELGKDIQAVNNELYMDRNMVRELSDLGYIGSHGHDHLPIGKLPNEDARTMINLAQEILSEINGKAPFSFSYPYGSTESIGNTADLLKDAGISFAFSMNRKINDASENCLCLNRFDNNDVPGGKAYSEGRFSQFELTYE